MSSLLAILFTTIGGSHGWGMKGTLLGHGKGAVLPGIIIGFGAAFATGNPKIIAFSWLIAAFGAVGMFPGGGMSYGETVSLVVGKEDPVRGTWGFAFKGFLWFAVAAGFISVGIMTLGMSVYTLADIILLTVLLIAARPVGRKLFNHAKHRLYFSKTRPESWGENLIMFAALACIMLVKGDFFSVTVMMCAGIFGAIGWAIGIWGFALGNHGKLFKFLGKRNMFEGWKFMEFTLGAFGGMGTAIGILLARKFFPEVLSGGWFVSSDGLSGYIPQNISLVLGIVWCLLCVFVTVFSQLTGDKPWGEDAEDWLFEIVYCAIPFLFLALGSYHTAYFIALPVLFYLFIEKYHIEKKRIPTPAAIVIYILIAALAVVTAVFTTAIPTFVVGLFGMIVYLIIELWEHFTRASVPGKTFMLRHYGHITVDSWFVVSAILTVVLWFVIV